MSVIGSSRFGAGQGLPSAQAAFDPSRSSPKDGSGSFQTLMPSKVGRDGTPALPSKGSASLTDLPRDGGSAQSVERLIDQGQSRDPRVSGLFGRAADSNMADYEPKGFVPEGRDDSLRGNDQRAIGGLEPLIQNGTIDRNTIVIGNHGHPDEIYLHLLSHPELSTQGIVRNVFKPASTDVIYDGTVDAQYSLDQRQSYGDSIARLQAANPGGGTIYFGTDARGIPPKASDLPTPEQVRAVMGEDAKIVLVNELDTGTSFEPADASGHSELGIWLDRMKAAGIPVSGFGIDDRGSSFPTMTPRSRLQGGL